MFDVVDVPGGGTVATGTSQNHHVMNVKALWFVGESFKGLVQRRYRVKHPRMREAVPNDIRSRYELAASRREKKQFFGEYFWSFR
jgi:hypothetical protein